MLWRMSEAFARKITGALDRRIKSLERRLAARLGFTWLLLRPFDRTSPFPLADPSGYRPDAPQALPIDRQRVVKLAARRAQQRDGSGTGCVTPTRVRDGIWDGKRDG
jgi:hypothetical protein